MGPRRIGEDGKEWTGLEMDGRGEGKGAKSGRMRQKEGPEEGLDGDGRGWKGLGGMAGFGYPIFQGEGARPSQLCPVVQFVPPYARLSPLLQLVPALALARAG